MPGAKPDKLINWPTVIVVAVVLIVFLGVYPKPVLSRIEPSVDRLVQHVQVATNTHQPQVAQPRP